ncbi:MAG: hypothetical protein PUE80_00825 [bacterium]|nr:hypothetical protein [bacterium]MDD6900883.1 hypothetical protein [bacterium]
MKKVMFLACLLMLGFSGSYAQRNAKATEKVFEQSQTRFTEPEVRTFINPVVADMKMLLTTRQEYGPYVFNLSKPFGELTQYQVEEFKKTSLYRANREAGSDIMIAALFNVYVNDNDKQKLIIDVSGFPAIYTNFHIVDINDAKELKMIETIYGNSTWISNQMKDRVNENAVK